MNNKVEHPFHCFYCGRYLEEIGLGMLFCNTCDVEFVPSVNTDGHQYLEDASTKGSGDE